MVSATNIAGYRFGRLIAIKRVGTSARRRALWKCICDCGTETICISGNLISGTTKSCGCFKADRTKEVKFIHGQNSSNPTYGTWSAMRGRCNNPNNPKYPLYGARGITVCERWNVFLNFLEDMGDRPPGKTIDRINNDGNYDPDNCRWATPKEQRANQGRNLPINHKESQ
ncbi:MAG: hypothetical protein ACYCZJ_13395 [Sulfuriferula sp.]